MPGRGLPSDLVEKEKSEAYRLDREVIEYSLLGPPQRPQPDRPLFVEFLVADRGFLTITVPKEAVVQRLAKAGDVREEEDEGDVNCLLVFTTPYRAADYRRTLLASGPPLKYYLTSPRKLVGILQGLRQSGIEQITLDRCPRCDIFSSCDTAWIDSADNAIRWWSITKGTELARMNLYLGHASAAARAGQLEVARDMVLETIAHVSLEDPRAHFLLGQIALAMRDRKLIREAKAFLQFLKLSSWERRLDDVVRSGSPNFEFTK